VSVLWQTSRYTTEEGFRTISGVPFLVGNASALFSPPDHISGPLGLRKPNVTPLLGRAFMRSRRKQDLMIEGVPRGLEVSIITAVRYFAKGILTGWGHPVV
jgi:hypothetical protein